MENEDLEVESMDWKSPGEFVAHFSDHTYAVVTAKELAACFPKRERHPEKAQEQQGSIIRRD